MPKAEFRSRRSDDRSRTKRLTLVPGLASMLADVPRDRLTSLARVWDVPDPENPGTADALYHRMTDPEAIDAVQTPLGEYARLVFRRLAKRSGPTRRSTLAEIVPFADDVVDDILLNLGNVGLVWPIQPPGRVGEVAEVWWFVPSDLARASRTNRPRDRATPQPAGHETAGSRVLPSHEAGLTPLESAPVEATPFAATSVLDRVLAGEAILGIMSDLDAERVRDVVHLGLALGVLEAHGRNVTPGDRSAAWVALDGPGRIRALTRIWSVDEADSWAVPAVIRRAVIAVLQSCEPGTWYDANEVARLVAVQTGLALARALENAQRSRAGINRSTVDRALVALGVIGTISIALDERDRPTALRLTDAGTVAIR
jgi:hypothetical protein